MILQTNYKMKPPPSAKPVKSILKKLGCVGLWVMNENGGLSVFDSSGNVKPTSPTGSPSWVLGIDGPAIESNLSNHFVLSTPNWTLSDFTIVARTKPDLVLSDHFIININDGANNKLIYHLKQQFTPDRQQLQIGNGTDSDYCAITPRTFENKWYDLAVTKKGGTVKFYVNGQVDGTAGIDDLTVTPKSNAALFGTGNNAKITQASFLLVCNQVLSAFEIALLYQKQFFMFGRKRQPMIPAAGGPPPEAACQFASLTTSLWWLKHNKGLYTEL